MATRSTPPLSTLLYVRDKASEPKRTVNVLSVAQRSPRSFRGEAGAHTARSVCSQGSGTASAYRDGDEGEEERVLATFVISKAAMLTGHR
ncbi:hypothetical protein GQ600_10456 [Phytophthora cactorum]|nr:hypothetical protein GQ600_10456 [Phytophthora cactorum]